LESKDFLREISFIFRNFLEQDLWYKNFSKLTLKEIYEAKSWKLKVESLEKNNLENWNLRFTSDILRILEDIYFKEYKEENLTEKEKEKIFLEVKTIILNEEK
jgi:hypothetical protein